jgi:hypothetical protein
MNVPTTTISAAQRFIQDLHTATCSADSASGFPTFLFAYSDVCPSTGCLAGCKDPSLPHVGNGYFGIFYTKDYMTGGPVVAKFPPPSLACSSRLRRPQDYYRFRPPETASRSLGHLAFRVAVPTPMTPLPVSVRSDSLAERSEFELPVPVSKLSDDGVVL